MATLVSPPNANHEFVQNPEVQKIGVGGAFSLSPVAFRFMTNITTAINGTETAGVAQNQLGNGMTISSGSGSPEGRVAGKIGDFYTDRSATSGSVFYVKEANAGLKTGWTAK